MESPIESDVPAVSNYDGITISIKFVSKRLKFETPLKDVGNLLLW